MYVCVTHPTAQQPEPNFSLLVTLTVFVAGATNQPDIQTQTGSYLRSGRVRTIKPSIAKHLKDRHPDLYKEFREVGNCSYFNITETLTKMA